MKRLNLQHGYHDALIKAIRYRDSEDVVIDIDLCSCCNPSPGLATLSFLGVRNFAEVLAALEHAKQANAIRRNIDEIVVVARDDQRGYKVFLSAAGAVKVDARGLHEA
jgi:hypothetical protein